MILPIIPVSGNLALPSLLNDTSRNKLDDYDVVTYHIKLFVADFVGKDLTDEAMQGRTEIKPVAIIAETGVTDIGIDNLEFETVFGFQDETFTSFSTVFTFQLKEPLGTTLLDRMEQAAAYVGARNFTKIPFFLEIYFVARDPSTGDPVVLDQTKKIFPVHIINCDISVDKGGSVYDCRAVRINDYAYDDNIGFIRQDINLDNVYDLYEAGAKLEEYLNSQEFWSQQHASFGPDGCPPEEYFFDFSQIPDPSFNEPAKDQLEKTGRNNSYDVLDNKTTNIHIPSGMPINRLIDFLMTNTKWLQEEINADERTKNDKNPLRFKTAFKVVSEVRFKGYHEGIGDYIRQITYRAVPITVGTSSSSTTNPVENDSRNVISYDSPPVSFGTNGQIVKKYNYLYTGMNTSVLNFNFKVNLAWYAALPQQYGYYTNANAHETGLTAHKPDTQGSNTALENTKIEADRRNKVDCRLTSSPDKGRERNLYITRDGNKESRGVYESSFRVYPYWHDNFGIIEADRTSARAKTNTLLRSYVQNAQQEFVTIDLEIRGDPDWYTNLLDNDRLKYFLFKTGFPTEPDPADGLLKVNQDSLVTGLFQILKAQNKFVNGKFTQVLYARRELLTKVI